MDKFDKGGFLLVNIAAQRARQLMQGAPALIRTPTRKPAAIAVKEVRDGLVSFYVPEEPPAAEETSVEIQEAGSAS